MALYYFERVLQQAANDPTLTLPYWDYATDAKLPLALRRKTYVNESGATVANPLRVAARRANLNSGKAGLASATTSSANAMLATTRADFEKRLEATPHGAVHCAIPEGGCPNGLMGAVPVAAIDPVFYLHHANIDRLYECWLQVDEAARLPTDQAIFDRRYSFIDSDGSVKERQVRDMLTTSQLGYTYSPGGAGCPPKTTAAITTPAPPPTQTTGATQTTEVTKTEPIASQKKGIELKRGMTEVPVEVEATGKTAARSVRSAIVTIDGVSAAVVPGVLYNVYLANGAGQRAQIGVINFFGFGGPPTGGKHAHGAMEGKNFEFDATAAVEVLGLSGTKKPILLFEPTTGLTDSTVDAATGAIPSNAAVTFRSARLRVR